MGDGCFLVVDDEDVVVRSLAKLILPFGDAIPATTTRQADVLLAGHVAWTGLIIDYQLPDGSGLDLLARARSRHPLVPALMLTGHNDREAANTAYDLDAEYLVKPAESAMITRFLTRASSRPAETDFAARIDRVVRAIANASGLSGAEADVLRRASLGESREDIAQARGSSPQTINKHVTNLLRRTRDPSLHHAIERVLREAGRPPIP
jgi:DNA-binding NarL/FixJ family response regulator